MDPSANGTLAKFPEQTKKGGPRTPEGKRKARRNAVRHGLFADLLLTDPKFSESSADYLRLLEALREGLKPRKAQDHVLVEVLAAEFLRWARLYQADSRIGPLLFARLAKSLDQNPEVFTQPIDREREMLVVQDPVSPDLLLRYGTMIGKNVQRLLQMLDPR